MRTRSKLLKALVGCLILVAIFAVVGFGEVKAASITDAEAITLGEQKSDSLTETEGIKFYKFTLESAGKLRIQISSQMTRLGIRIYDSEYNSVTGDTFSHAQGGTGIATYSYELKGGEYYLRTIGSWWDYNEANYTGSYVLTPSFESAGVNHDVVDNATLLNAAAIEPNSTTYGHLAINDGLDYFKMELPSAGDLKFEVTSYMTRWGIRIYDSAYASVAGNTLSWQSDSEIGIGTYRYQLDKGTYYIRCMGNWWDYNDPNYTGKYNFTSTFTSAGVNHAEPNNTIQQPADIQVGSQVKGHLAENNGLDYFKVTLDKTGKYSFPFSFEIARLGLRIYDAQQKSVGGATMNWNEGTGLGVAAPEFDLEAGTYYLRVMGNWWDYADANYLGRYDFTVTYKDESAILNPPTPTPTQAPRQTAKPSDDKPSPKKVKVSKPKAPVLKKVKNVRGRRMQANLKRVSGANGYEIRVATNRKFRKAQKSTTSSTVFSFYNLKRRTYFVSVRAYKYGDGGKRVYSKWSKVKKVRIRR